MLAIMQRRRLHLVEADALGLLLKMHLTYERIERRNPHYHTSHDVPATLDYDRMAAVTRGLATSLASPGAERV